MERADKRKLDEMRNLRIVRNYIAHAEGSVFLEMGKTVLVCTATVEEKVPLWLKDSNKGWVTAEYGMLPRSTQVRLNREKSHSSGRSQEISRLIGRALRAVIELSKLGERTIWVDCDVLQADGGTRTAAINGAMIALADAVKFLRETDRIKKGVLKDFLAAVSVGVIEGEEMLDLAYEEDSHAEVDMNIVMTGSGRIVEVQGTAEGEPFDRRQLDKLLDLGSKGIMNIVEVQRDLLKNDIPLVFSEEALNNAAFSA
jgi:ribonuclease PH